ncbi:MAG TPA: hypothetical protein VM661_05920 [Candidatus Sulfotelmatobacter sp.]|jgi:hypothetical protein|nr:hypothetical protein [Candidatus Sulfotelmatobacter sp.]
MTDAPDLQQLARRYMDLWQDQMAAVVNDPKLAESMAQAYTLMTKSAAAIAQATNIKAGDANAKGAHEPNTDSPLSSGAASGAAAPAVPSDEPGLDAAVLARRVAELEERVLRLEAALAAGGGQPAAKSRRRRPSGV